LRIQDIEFNRLIQKLCFRRAAAQVLGRVAGLLARAHGVILTAVAHHFGQPSFHLESRGLNLINDSAKRSGFSGFVEKMGLKKDASGVIADPVKWFVRLIVLVTTFDALGLPAVSQVLQQFLLWLPNLVVALVILVLAGLAANALAKLVRGATAEAGPGNPDMLGTIATVGVCSADTV
jgi:Conserved TM helix